MIQTERLDNLPELSAGCGSVLFVFRKKIWFILWLRCHTWTNKTVDPCRWSLLVGLKQWGPQSYRPPAFLITLKTSLTQIYSMNVIFAVLYTPTLPFYKSKSDLIKCLHSGYHICMSCIMRSVMGRCGNILHTSVKSNSYTKENLCNYNTMVCIVYCTSPTRTDPCKL